MGFDLEKLDAIAEPRSQKALDAAEARKKNKEWLRMSQKIALTILCYLRDENMTRLQFAEKLGVTPTYVGRILKGQENLTLSTICRLQEVMGRQLVSVGNSYHYKIQLKPESLRVFQKCVAGPKFSKNLSSNVDSVFENDDDAA